MIPRAFTALAKMKQIFVSMIAKEPLGTVRYASYHMHIICVMTPYGSYHLVCDTALMHKYFVAEAYDMLLI